MGTIDRIEALRRMANQSDEQTQAEQEARRRDLDLLREQEEEASSLPQVFVRLHGPPPTSKRIIQLPPWYPGEWLLPRLRHPIRTVLGWFSLPPKAWSLFRALTGGIVRDAERKARNEACAVCPARQVWITGRKERHYCGACGCARWWLSRLQNKNKLRKWACPLRRWDEAKAGPYPDADLRAVLVGSGYVSEDDLRPTSGGCGGCGGASTNGTAN